MAEPAQPEPSRTHAELIEAEIERELGESAYLAQERRYLPTLFAPDEVLLAVTITGLRAQRVGLLAITDRRVIHVYFRNIARRMRVTNVDYRNVESVRAGGWRSFAGIRVHLIHRQRIFWLARRYVDFPLGLPGHGMDDAERLATCIRKAAVRASLPRSDAPPWKNIGR